MQIPKLLLPMLLLMFSCPAFAGEPSVLGTWLTADGKSKVDIQDCGKALCGRIVWLKVPTYPEGDKMAGQVKIDRENPDTALRTRQILGLKMLSGFHPDGENVWSGGQIYDPRNGKTYSCTLTLENEHRLKVRGYVGISLFGRTVVWTR